MNLHISDIYSTYHQMIDCGMTAFCRGYELKINEKIKKREEGPGGPVYDSVHLPIGRL